MASRSFYEIRDHCDLVGLDVGEVWNAVITYRENLKRMEREAAVNRVMQAAKDGTAVELSANDIATAKLYARARCLNELNKSIYTLVEVRDDVDAKPSDRVRAAESLIARAIGPVESPSAIPFSVDLAKASPTEIIDALIEGVNTGSCSTQFATMIRDLLSAKVQSQKLEDLIGARSRVINHVPGNQASNGQASDNQAPVATGVIPTWAQRVSTEPPVNPK